MAEAHTDPRRRPGRTAAFNLGRQLEELVRGECSADEFVRENVRGTGAAGTWHIKSYVDQRHRLGQISDDLFNAIQSSVARVCLEKQEREFGTTVELAPAGPSTPRDAIPIRTAPIGVSAVPVPANDAQALAPASIADEFPSSTGRPADKVQPGLVLGGRYLLESELGSGGMGVVFRAVDRRAPLPTQSARRIALKVLRDHPGERADVRVRLRREFHCTQVLSHPNIIKVFDLACDGDPAFYTMELLEGESLHRLLARTQPAGLPRPYAWAIIRAIGSALAHAHSRNIIHGDLKPQNVMVTQKGEVRVLDFGSSRTSDNEGIEPAILTATPPYASCDVLEGGRPDACDDLYALACMSYELLAGRHPFDSRNAIQARAAAEHPDRPDGLGSRAWQALQAGLSWSRTDRSMPVHEWLGDLGVDIGPQCLPSFSPAPAGWRERLRASPWRDFLVPLGAAALALILLAALFHRPQATPAKALPAAVARSPAAQVPTMAASPAAAALAAAIPSAPSAPVETPRPVSPTASTGTAPVPESPPPKLASPAAIHGRQAPMIWLEARTHAARSGSRFVEIRVHANTEVQGFTWWTEDGSAHAGRDYIAQSRTQRSFTRNRQMASLFVRLLPPAAQAEVRTFYIRVAPPPGTTARISRTAVLLPATR